jgi:hypothetical protein
LKKKIVNCPKFLVGSIFREAKMVLLKLGQKISWQHPFNQYFLLRRNLTPCAEAENMESNNNVAAILAQGT